MTNNVQKTNYPALYTLIVVFFFWGFIAAGNNIFIPFCKEYFHLDQFQSQLIDFSFYTAYYLGGLLLFTFGMLRGKDLVTFWGYRKSIIFGLLFSALGAGAMILAVEANVYIGMLCGLFIMALGFSLQQTAANPFAILLGDPKTGASRVNLGGGINSLGTTIGPLIVAFALFGTTAAVNDEQIKTLSLDKVVLLYSCVGFLFIAAACLFYFSKKLPDGKSTEPIEKSTKALTTLIIMTVLLFLSLVPVFQTYKSVENDKVIQIEKQINSKNEEVKSLSYVDSIKLENLQSEIATLKTDLQTIKVPLENKRMMWLAIALFVVLGSLASAYFRSRNKTEGWGAMQYPQLLLGMIALFMYVGVEVAIGSNLGELLKTPDFGSLQASEITPYVSMYWGSMMIGRWAGAISAFQFSANKKRLLTILMPFIAFSVIIAANTLANYDMSQLYFYVICVVIQIVAFFVSKDKPVRTLVVFSAFGILALLVGLNTTGTVAIYAFLSGGLACSIMWPSIFNLALMGLGKYTAQGSAFLVMMILGGGIIPPIQGKLADMIGIHWSYLISLVCFIYILFYAIIVKKVLQKQGISVEESNN
ncbi:MFS transporter [Paenimyroides tangerinum]|uniref:MFS transporter n=1 Tax=Paenimyroides tangerinum TaxID=2488728 RepID=A0A3P3WF20_9FLAO|nr:MFS transporter [Paenimyroides tangerinum]RRJ92636.1 MFS transporter [Paenimyroides tangerinum]